MLKVIRCGFNTEWPSHDLGRVDKVGEVAGWHVLSHFPHGVPLWVYVFAARSVVWVIGSDWLHHMSCCYWRHHTHYGRLNDTFCCVLLCTPQQRLPFSGPDKPYKLPFWWGSSPPPHLTHGSLGPREPRLDWFSHFCKAHEHGQQTDRHADHATTGMRVTCLYFPAALWPVLTPIPQREGGWVGLSGWLHNKLLRASRHPSVY